MPASLRCFLYKKSAYSFLVGCLFPGSIMDSVPPGFSQLPQVWGSLGHVASSSIHCFHALFPDSEFAHFFYFEIWDSGELGNIYRSRRVIHMFMLTCVQLVIHNGHFSSPHNREDSRKPQGFLQTLLTIFYPGKPVVLALQVHVFY